MEQFIYMFFFTEAGRSPDPSHKETYSKRRTFSTSKSNLISFKHFKLYDVETIFQLRYRDNYTMNYETL